MSETAISQAHKDALQETINIAMGQAGDYLARVLDIFVRLSVPRIQMTDPAQFNAAVRHMVKSTAPITAVRQDFHDPAHTLHGNAFVLFDKNGGGALGELMGYESTHDPHAERELLLDVSNILAGACLNGIAAQLDTEFEFLPPSLLAEQSNPGDIFPLGQIPWRDALLIEVNFGVEQCGFKSHLLIVLPDASITTVRDALDTLLASLFH